VQICKAYAPLCVCVRAYVCCVCVRERACEGGEGAQGMHKSWQEMQKCKGSLGMVCRLCERGCRNAAEDCWGSFSAPHVAFPG